jgi:hypothetical protein
MRVNFEVAYLKHKITFFIYFKTIKYYYFLKNMSAFRAITRCVTEGGVKKRASSFQT